MFILVFFLISPFLTSDKAQQSRPPDTPADKQSEVCELAAATRNPKHLYGRGGGEQQGGRWPGLRAPRAPGEGQGKSGSLHGSGKDQSEFINQREAGLVVYFQSSGESKE